MPQYFAPGVYVEEVSSGSKPIAGVGTNTAGFVGVQGDAYALPNPYYDRTKPAESPIARDPARTNLVGQVLAADFPLRLRLRKGTMLTSSQRQAIERASQYSYWHPLDPSLAGKALAKAKDKNGKPTVITLAGREHVLQPPYIFPDDPALNEVIEALKKALGDDAQVAVSAPAAAATQKHELAVAFTIPLLSERELIREAVTLIKEQKRTYSYYHIVDDSLSGKKLAADVTVKIALTADYRISQQSELTDQIMAVLARMQLRKDVRVKLESLQPEATTALTDDQAALLRQAGELEIGYLRPVDDALKSKTLAWDIFDAAGQVVKLGTDELRAGFEIPSGAAEFEAFKQVLPPNTSVPVTGKASQAQAQDQLAPVRLSAPITLTEEQAHVLRELVNMGVVFKYTDHVPVGEQLKGKTLAEAIEEPPGEVVQVMVTLPAGFPIPAGDEFDEIKTTLTAAGVTTVPIHADAEEAAKGQKLSADLILSLLSNKTLGSNEVALLKQTTDVIAKIPSAADQPLEHDVTLYQELLPKETSIIDEDLARRIVASADRNEKVQLYNIRGLTLTARASLGKPVLCTSFSEFQHNFLGLTINVKNGQPSYLAHAVYGFFNNGGTRCWVAAVAAPEEIKAVLDEEFARIDEIALVAAPGITDLAVQTALLDHCEHEYLQDRFAILDGHPLDASTSSAYTKDNIQGGLRDSTYGALYFPWIAVFDPVTKAQQPDGDGRLIVPPSGHIAGVYARVDSARGVHKAPANEVIRGALDVQHRLSKAHHAGLNPEDINVIRRFDGNITIYGAHTLAGKEDPEWRYINVRRLFLFLRESIDEGTQWVVFEPNSPDLWAKIRRNVTAFLTLAWRDGALLGTTPEEAFYVKCDAETNPPEVRDAGMCITEIGVAPVKPAEFVIFRISQWAGPPR